MPSRDAYLIDFPAVPAPPLPLRRSVTSPAAPDAERLGIDLDVIDDLPPTFRLASGQKNLANALVRQLITPEGALAAFGGDPEYGYDLRDKLNESWTQAGLATLGAEIVAKWQRDERVKSVTVTASHNLATSTLKLDAQVESAAGPFALIVQISDVGIEMLRPE
jgi:hypothetical protein